jgi:hypothetical protein
MVYGFLHYCFKVQTATNLDVKVMMTGHVAQVHINAWNGKETVIQTTIVLEDCTVVMTIVVAAWHGEWTAVHLLRTP